MIKRTQVVRRTASSGASSVFLPNAYPSKIVRPSSIASAAEDTFLPNSYPLKIVRPSGTQVINPGNVYSSVQVSVKKKRPYKLVGRIGKKR